MLSFKVLCPRGGLTLKTQHVLNHELMSSMKEYLTQGRWINKLKLILNLQHSRKYFPFPAPENYDPTPTPFKISDTKYFLVFVSLCPVFKHDCIFFVGTQFWEADKTLKFLAEQQYFNKDKSSTDNPVKVCKLLYLAFGSALSCTSICCYTCCKGEEKYEVWRWP